MPLCEHTLECYVSQYKIFYAKSLERDKYGEIQDYMLDTDPGLDISGSFVSRYASDPGGGTTPGETGLKIVKLEEGTKTPLEGAVFKVTAPNGTVVGRFSSGQDGTVTIPLSITGHYTVEEETAPLWHLLDENAAQHVSVKHGEIATVTFENAPYGNLQVRKVDADTGANLNGANVQIKNTATGAVFSAVTAAGGVATFEKLEPGTYQVTELTAPEGYVLNSRSENVVVNTGELATVTLKNSAKPGLRVIKYDSKTMTILPGAAFEISRDGTSLGRFITDEQGMIELLDAQPGTYLVREVQVDDSHIADPTPQQIELSPGDGIRELIFYNAQKPGVHILKVDSDNPLRPLSGAVFEIKSVGDSFQEERKTEGDGTIDLSDLEPGAYTIKEKKAPDGYLLNDAVRTIQIEGNRDQSFVFTDTAKPSLTLVKLDSYDSSPLGGVTFRIAKIEDGSHYLDRVTDTQGRIHLENLEPGVYSVSEIDVPEGYVRNMGEWHMELFPGGNSELVVTNDRKPNLIIWKHDADTGEPVPDTVFQVRAADGHSVDELKTDSEGKATLSNLLPGVYEISEKSVPSAYLLDAPSQLVTLYPNRDRTVYFENHKKPSLTVMKVDSASGDVIKGAEFHFWYGSNNTTTGELNDLGTYQTNADGLVRLTGLRDGWYQVTETEPAKGYAIKEPGEQSVFLKGGESRELVFENIPLSAIVVWKFDSVTKTAISGAEFQVRYLGGTSGTGGTVIGTYKTGANGAFTVTGLKGGTYVVEEVSSDTNHVIDTAPQTVLITGQDQDVVQVYFGNTPKGTALIRKIDALTHEPLSGVEFTVTDSTGAAVGDGNGKFTTDSSGSFLVEDLDPGVTLVVRESRAKDGYILDETPQTVQVKPGKTVKLEFANQPKSSLMIVKKDAATGKPLSGVEFLVTAADGTYIGPGNGKYTTDSAGTILIHGLTPGTSVVVRETRAKNGYLLDDAPQTATIKAGSTAELEFLNQPAGTLIVEKRDSLTNEPLAGVEFKITTASGEFVPDADGKLSGNGLYKTDSEGQIILSGIVGMLIVTETKTIDGYVIDPESKSQTVVVEPNDTQKLVFYNTPKNTLIITKYATDTMEPLAGVKYLVTASDGSAIGNSNGIYFTDERGQAVVHDLTPGTTVTAREMETVSGYTLETTPQSILVKAGEPLNLIFGNKPLCNLTIQKRDSRTKKPLAGARFLVTGQAGLPIGPSGGRFTTGSSGLVTVTGIRPGTAVTVREEKAPSGYVLDTQPQTITVKSNEDNTLTFDNDSKGTLVIVKVDSETGAPLPGAEFKITTAGGELAADQEGTVSSNGIYTTDQRGEIRISGLEPDSYVVTETKAPKGHVLDSTPVTVEVTANDTPTLRIPNTPTNTLVIQKVIAGTDGEPLKGVKFLVTDDSGAPVGPSNGEFVTDENGRVTLQGLTPGSTITAREVQTVEGFVLDGTPKSIKIKEGEVQSLTFENKRAGTLVIQKKDSVTGQPLAGVEFQLTYADGSFVDDANGHLSSKGLYKTDTNGEIRISGVVGTLVITETKPLPGYVMDEGTRTQTVKVNPTDTQTITVYNTKVGGLTIIKKDEETGERIKGVQFEVRKLNGEIVGTYITDTNGVISLPQAEKGWYQVVELKAAESYKLDDTPHQIEVKDGETATLEITNRQTGSAIIHKVDSLTGEGIYGVKFLISDATGHPVGTYESDNEGYVYIERELPDGKYTARELECADGYILDTVPKTFYVEYGGCTTITWPNTAVQGQIQIVKKSADYNPTNGLPAGTLLEGATFEIYNERNGNKVDTIVTGANGLAASKALPLGRYTIRETKAPANYSANGADITAVLEYSGQIVCFEVTNKSVNVGVAITKTGPREAVSGQPVRYVFSGISNTSNVTLDSYYWRDTLPVSVTLDKVVTGTYNRPGTYKVIYRVNSAGDYRTLADSLSTSRNYTLAASPAALGLAANERITEIMFVFGQVPGGFAQVEAPMLYCTAVKGLGAGSSFVNVADAGGTYNGVWVQAVTRWVTTVYGKPTPLPRTGY